MEKNAAVASILLMLVAAASLSAAAATSSSDMADAILRLPGDTKSGSAGKATMATARSGYGERPWTCCTVQVCTLSFPPICRCFDKVEHCSDACEDCEEVEGSDNFPVYMCKDKYEGTPALPCWGWNLMDQLNRIVHPRPGIADQDSSVATVAAAAGKEHDDEEKKKPVVVGRRALGY